MAQSVCTHCKKLKPVKIQSPKGEHFCSLECKKAHRIKTEGVKADKKVYHGPYRR